MRRDAISTTSVLNRASDLVRATAVPSGVLLFVAALPFRLLQADYIERLLTVDDEARYYGDALDAAAAWTMAAFVILCVARVQFVRSCRFAILQTTPATISWRSRFLLFLPAVTLGLFFQLLSIAFSCTLLAVPLIASLAAISTVVLERLPAPRAGDVLRSLPRYTRAGGTIAGLMLVFVCALLVTIVNLFYIFQLLVWLMGGVPFFDATLWSALLQPTTRIFSLAVVAGALAALEPFWYAAYAAYVHAIDARESGDDLRSWYASLRDKATTGAASSGVRAR